MRLIDADVLSAKMYHEAFETNTNLQRWDNGCWIRFKMFENALKDTPTIETERKKGRWLHEEIVSSNSETGFFLLPECMCSECNVMIAYEVNYCPNCGADMRGGDTNGND